MNQRNKALLIDAASLVLAIASTGMVNYGSRRLYMPEPYQSLTVISTISLIVVWPMTVASFLLATILQPTKKLAYVTAAYVKPVRILLSMGPSYDSLEKESLGLLIAFGIGSVLKMGFIALVALVVCMCIIEPPNANLLRDLNLLAFVPWSSSWVSCTSSDGAPCGDL